MKPWEFVLGLVIAGAISLGAAVAEVARESIPDTMPILVIGDGGEE